MVFESIDVFFQKLNEIGKYVILRNFEGFPESIMVEQHPDIDILCENASVFVNLLDLQNRGNYKDNIHFCVIINEKTVDLDLRQYGDGYYDESWEHHILEYRTQYNGIWVPSDEDYFYTLMYHVLIQKKQVAHEYKIRLTELASRLGILLSLEDCTLLNEFMRRNQYKYTYPVSPFTTFNSSKADKSLVEKNPIKKVQRILAKISRKIGR